MSSPHCPADSRQEKIFIQYVTVCPLLPMDSPKGLLFDRTLRKPLFLNSRPFLGGRGWIARTFVCATLRWLWFATL